MNKFSAFGDINILGYDGFCLSLIFETLKAIHFKGIVNIFLNDGKKRSETLFTTDIKYNIYNFSEISTPPNQGNIISSNKPTTKKLRMLFIQDKWNISKKQMLSLIHPSCIIASTVKIDHGFYMEPLSVIASFTKIGFCVTVNRNCSVGHHNIFHDYCSIHPGANLTGNVEICEAATIGPGCTIFNSVKIGSNSIIGGGSVVSKDIQANVLACGNPGKIIREL